MNGIVFDVQRFVDVDNSTSNTLISGSAYADSIYNVGSYVTINSGAGADSIDNYFGSRYASINSGTGNDSVSNYGYKSTINTGDGSDSVGIHGYTDGSDGGAYSFVNTGNGNDSVLNCMNYVTIKGGAGNDLIQSGYDTVVGNYARIDAGAGNDTVSLYSDAFNNVIQYASGDGNDIIYGLDSNDTLKITGGSYKKSTVGSDVLVTVGSGVITLSGAAGKTINIKGTIIGGGSSGSGKSISNTTKNTLVSGTSYSDTISNSAGGVTLRGGAGNDSIYNSTSGSYTINSSYGYVTIDGGSGNDTIYSNDPHVSINGGDGNDTIYSNAYSSGYATIKGGYGNDTISLGSDGQQLIQYASGDGNDIIYGLDSNDTLKITGGSYKKSTVGSDVLVTVGSGVITLSGAAGKTINIKGTIIGGGNSVITVPSANTLVSGTSRNDSIYNSSGYSRVTINSGAGNDYISNSYGYYASINGGVGNDIINSSGDYTTINGGAGNDRISITSSSTWYNTVSGGAGNDTIYGQNRTAYGYVYRYANGDGYDKIYNYGSADTVRFTSGYYKKSTVGSSVVLYSYSSSNSSSANGAITLVGAAGKTINVAGSVKPNPDSKKWRLNGTTAKYGTSSKTLVTVKGVKSLSGLSLSGKVVTVAKSSLNNSKVTISGSGYTLKLARDVPSSTTKTAAWSYANSTATYKSSYKTAGYSLAGNRKSISYTRATSARTLAKITGAKSKSGLRLSGKKISLASSALKNKVTVSGSGNYEFDFASGYKNATITGTSNADTITARGSGLRIFGGKGNDSIKMVGSGQIISGGDGADTFVYAASGGKERITDFKSNDKLKIGTNGTGTYSTVKSDSNLIVSTDDGGKITLVGAADLSSVNIIGTKKNSGRGVKVSNNGKKITLTEDYTDRNFSLAESYSSAVTLNAANVLRGLNITGNDIANRIIGGSQDDTINGGEGSDTIYGGDGNDELRGGQGNDELRGGIGKDTLWGGTGDDKLYGGEGRDVFYYKIGDGDDTIFGYEASVDKIMLGSGSISNVTTDRDNNVIFTIGEGQLVINKGADSSIIKIVGPDNRPVDNGLWPR